MEEAYFDAATGARPHAVNRRVRLCRKSRRRVSRESSLEQGGVQLDSSPASSSLKTTPFERRRRGGAAAKGVSRGDPFERLAVGAARGRGFEEEGNAQEGEARRGFGVRGGRGRGLRDRVTAIAKSYQAEQDGRARLAEAISSVEESYESIRMLEETVSTASAPLSQLDSETLNASVEETDDALTATRSRLESDRTRLEGMYDALENNGDREACNEAIAVANASVNMIDAGRKILSETAQASNAHALSEGGGRRCSTVMRRPRRGEVGRGDFS